MTPSDDGGDVGKKPDSHHDPDQQSRFSRLVYTIGLPLVGIVLGFPGLWMLNHWCALLALAAVISAVLIFECWMRGKTQTGKVLVALIFVVAALVDSLVGPIHQPEIDVTGSLHAGNRPTPANACSKVFPNPPARAVTVIGGGNAGILTGAPKMTLLQVDQCRLVSVQRTAEGISINADIFNTEGSNVATITDNKFSVRTNDRVHFHPTGDLSTLSVHDEHEDELLWVRYLNPSAIQVRGIFACSGVIATLTEEATKVGGLTSYGNCAKESGVVVIVHRGRRLFEGRPAR